MGGRSDDRMAEAGRSRAVQDCKRSSEALSKRACHRKFLCKVAMMYRPCPVPNYCATVSDNSTAGAVYRVVRLIAPIAPLAVAFPVDV